MQWSEVKWSEVKWSEVKWSEVKWSEVVLRLYIAKNKAKEEEGLKDKEGREMEWI